MSKSEQLKRISEMFQQSFRGLLWFCYRQDFKGLLLNDLN